MRSRRTRRPLLGLELLEDRSLPASATGLAGLPAVVGPTAPGTDRPAATATPGKSDDDASYQQGAGNDYATPAADRPATDPARATATPAATDPDAASYATRVGLSTDTLAALAAVATASPLPEPARTGGAAVATPPVPAEPATVAPPPPAVSPPPPGAGAAAATSPTHTPPSPVIEADTGPPPGLGRPVGGIPDDSAGAAQAQENPPAADGPAPQIAGLTAGLTGADPRAIGERLEAFLARLGLLGDEPDGGSALSRLAPWGATAAALALAAELARRRRKKTRPGVSASGIGGSTLWWLFPRVPWASPWTGDDRRTDR
jgi:hypothetical protein